MCTLDLTVPDSPGTSRQPTSSVGQSRTTRIVFVAGDRGGTQRSQVQIPREYTSIQDAIRGSAQRDSFDVVPPILAASRQTLVEAHRHRPTILHFVGHGDDRSLSFVLD